MFFFNFGFILSVIGTAVAVAVPRSSNDHLINAFKASSNRLMKEVMGPELNSWLNSLSDVYIAPTNKTVPGLRHGRSLDAAPVITQAVTLVAKDQAQNIIEVGALTLYTCTCGVNTNTGENTCAMLYQSTSYPPDNYNYHFTYFFFNNQVNCDSTSHTFYWSFYIPKSSTSEIASCDGSLSLPLTVTASVSPWTNYTSYPAGIALFSYGNEASCNDVSMPYFQYSYFAFPQCGKIVYEPWCNDPVGSYTAGNVSTYAISTTTFGQKFYHDASCENNYAEGQYTYPNACTDMHNDDFNAATKFKSSDGQIATNTDNYEIPWHYDTMYVIGDYATTSSDSSDDNVSIPKYDYIILIVMIFVALFIGIVMGVGGMQFIAFKQKANPPLAHMENSNKA